MDALEFLVKSKTTHMRAFTIALETMGKEWPASWKRARTSWQMAIRKMMHPPILPLSARRPALHHKIAAYTTGRNLALQLHQPGIVELLTISLGEEQNAGLLLDEVAQPLMSVAKMPATVE